MPSLTPLLWLRVVFLPGGSVFCFLAVVVVVVVVVAAVSDFWGLEDEVMCFLV